MVHGYTTIEQSKKLLSLGLDPNTADMCYPHFIRHGTDTYNEIPEIAEDIDYPYEMPCWSLTALLELMPACINNDNDFLVIEKDETYLNEPIWRVSYKNFIKEDIIAERELSPLLNAAFKTVCWLIEQGHIKVNK